MNTQVLIPNKPNVRHIRVETESEQGVYWGFMHASDEQRARPCCTLEIIEEGERRVKPSDQPRRPTPSGGMRTEELGDASALGLAVIASGIESAGGRLVVTVGPRGATTARVFLPLWTESS